MGRVHRGGHRRRAVGVADLLVFEQGVAVAVGKRRFTLGPLEVASGVSPAARGAPSAGQQHAKSQHCHRADHDPEQEQRAGRPSDVIAEHREVLGQRVRGPGIAQHTHDRDDDGDEQDDQSNDDKHDGASISDGRP